MIIDWGWVTTVALIAFRFVECIVKVTPGQADDQFVAAVKEFFKIG